MMFDPDKFECTSCVVCGIEFCVPVPWIKARRHAKDKDDRDLYCPNGHLLSFKRNAYDRLKDEADQVRRRAERAEQDRARWQDEAARHERSATAYKGHLTRTKRRVGHGVCPCCNRQFKNLQAHMENQHPDYADTPPADAEVAAE